MNKHWLLCLSALLLSACSSPVWKTAPDASAPAAAGASAITHDELLSWLSYADKVLHSNDAERKRSIQSLRRQDNNNELQLALWLSHPKAEPGQRQQAQQLLSRNMPVISPSLKQFFAVYQGYNQEMLALNELAEQRQAQVESLSSKLKELATIDEQISERKYQGPGQP
ncbi:hypothetical protein [Zobellella maritima]|uniref:hypothetical protein n=1 Tax=Zobellella maritima TaxID=2059725 RepID=UPI000E30724C|nr:hypothetical protein [Zobellella maritima]